MPHVIKSALNTATAFVFAFLVFPALRKNSTGPPFYAAFANTTNSVLVAAMR